MTQDEIIEMARQAGIVVTGEAIYTLCKLAVEKEREVVANWIMNKGFATGHGDSIVDLLDQLQWQIEEKEREACALICDAVTQDMSLGPLEKYRAAEIAKLIRARGQA